MEAKRVECTRIADTAETRRRQDWELDLIKRDDQYNITYPIDVLCD